MADAITAKVSTTRRGHGYRGVQLVSDLSRFALKIAPIYQALRGGLLVSLGALLLPALGTAQTTDLRSTTGYDTDAALQRSQAAIGRQLSDTAFTDTAGNPVRLSDYADKPLLISLVFTSCYHTCPVTTKHLARAVSAAREALDEDSFRVVTIGFDVANDTPEAMRAFARKQNIRAIGWEFLSGSSESIARLTDDLGFFHVPSPRGFDHIAQISIVDRAGVVHTQVYGEMFELPWLVEPLKDLVFNRASSVGHILPSLFDRIRIFCTVYDPSTGRYKVDYSLFIQMTIGLLIVLSVIVYLWREARLSRR